MDHAIEVALIERILANVDANARDMAKATVQTPVAEYIDPVRYTREVELLFRGQPMLVGHVSEAREPGDFITHDATGVPILVVRGQSGELNAFINICRHRGAKVCLEPGGKGRRAFVCPYHAWTYGPDGALIGRPDADGFADADPADLGLTRLPAAERHGFVWVCPRPGADFDIDAHLGIVGADIDGYDLARHMPFRSEKHGYPVTIRRRMNWKLMMDTFLEAYHFKYAHPESVYPLFLDNAALFERHGHEIRWIMPKRTMLDLKRTDPSTWRLRDHSLIMHYIFPNTMLVTVADHTASFVHFPVGPDESVMLLTVYVPEDQAGEKRREYWDKNQDMLLAAIDEDFTIGETMQAGYRSGAQTHLTYGRYEHALGWFHDSVNQALAAAAE